MEITAKNPLMTFKNIPMLLSLQIPPNILSEIASDID